MLRGRYAIVLLVEDNENDIELTKIAFEQAEFAVDLHVVRDGEQCLAFLRKQGTYIASPTPDLVLLDLHMPRMGGMEALDEMKGDVALRHIPVVILTTSTSENDINQGYRSHCSGYLVKPIGFADFVKLVQRVEEYWFAMVTLPSGG